MKNKINANNNHYDSVVFFGSGPVALETIKHLKNHFKLEAVITKPKPPYHHGSTPVFEYISSTSTPIFTPNSKSELDELFETHDFHSKVGLVVDYGIIIPEKVLDSFPLGIVNSHFSLLPEWRGADPITFSILSGQKSTGVSLMKIAPELDTGDLIAQEQLPESPQSLTTPELTSKLIKLSNQMITKHLPSYLSGQLAAYKQPDVPASYSRKLTKQDSILDPKSKTAAQLEREVRAFAGWPKSRLNIHGHDIIVTKSHVKQAQSSENIDISQDYQEKNQTNKKPELIVKCLNSTELIIDELIAPSGKKMSGEAFLRGYPAVVGKGL
jgi:methionyl-tRNA formyltransferase